MNLTADFSPVADVALASRSAISMNRKSLSHGFRLEGGYCWCLTWRLHDYENDKPEFCDSNQLRAMLRTDSSAWPARIYCLRQLDGDAPSWQLLPVHSLYDLRHPSDRPIFSDKPVAVGFDDLPSKFRIDDEMVILNRRNDG